MKTNLGFRALIVLVVFALARGWSDDGPKEHSAPAARTAADVALDEIGSLSRLLYELAAERYSANSNRSETWIFTVHQGQTIRKYSDGKYIVLSLPLVQQTDKIAMCRFAAQYNAFNIRAADSMVKAGKYVEARELFKLVLHFDRCDDELLKERTQNKLVVLDRLEKQQNVESNLKEFSALCEQLGSLVDLSGVDKITPTVVTNLFKVRLL